MSGLITFRVLKNETHRANVDWDDRFDSVVLGRMQAESEIRFVLNDDPGNPRIPFADFRDSQYSRNHARISRVGESKVEIQNTCSSAISVVVNSDTVLTKDQSVERPLPVTVTIGEFSIRVERSLNSLSRQTRFHRDFAPVDSDDAPFIDGDAIQNTMAGLMVDHVSAGNSTMITENIDPNNVVGNLIEQLSTANSILQQTTTQDALYSQAITAVKRLIDMDGVAIVNAVDTSDMFTLDPVEPSYSAVEEVCQSRQVRWSSVNQSLDTNVSQMGLEYFIGAPIVVPKDNADEVRAVLYAHRSLINVNMSRGRRQPLTELHAKVFELIACSIAAGLVRIEHQATQGRFQQFFTPALARELMKSDAVLKPCQREVTVLFSDIRRFSNISEKLGPSQTSDWVQDVLTGLSDCVINHDGVLVDYIGDELMAMWGAPADQPNHATLACNCAQDIMKLIPVLNERWREKIGAETQVGIGINTGMANVGNTGSKYKFKYGPLGDTVNRASRVQGLTKYLRVKTILTGDTHAQLPESFRTRRLGKAKVVNIDKKIELFELILDTDADSTGFAGQYEIALENLELGNLESAAGIIKDSLNFDAPDHPALLIMNEIINRVIKDQRSGDFEWEFENK